MLAERPIRLASNEAIADSVFSERTLCARQFPFPNNSIRQIGRSEICASIDNGISGTAS
jgi:hypothetical protein